VSTVSTGPDRNAEAPLAGLAGHATGAEPTRLLSRRVWLAAAISVLVVGSALRLYNLELVPLHHDEGVNGFFLTNLFRTFYYQYNPENYHGPSLYYFGLVSAYLLGLNTVAIRITTAIFGIATIWLILAFKKQIGDAGALVGASLVAVSPGAVYLSRYFIHETLFVYFTLGVVVGLLRYKSYRNLRDLVLAWTSASLLFATKETSVITGVVLLAAATLSTLYVRMRLPAPPVTSETDLEGAEGVEEAEGTRRVEEAQGAEGPAGQGAYRVAPSARVSWLSVRDIRAVDWGVAAALAILLSLVLYSSFFSNPHGVPDSLRAFKMWAHTGEQQHTHPWNTYLEWLWQEEAPLVLVSAVAALANIWLGRRLGVFASLWALGLLAAYSLIPYKTPWLMLNFIIPMTIAVGCAANSVLTRMKFWTTVAAAAVLCAVLSVSAVRCIRLNFYHFDDEKEAYVYAHTQREFLGLVNDITEMAEQAGTGKTTEIAVTSPDYWPLPWYLRSYPGVGYHGKITSTKAPIVVGSEAQEHELDEMLGEQYTQVGHYSLRPGVVLILYTHRSSAGG